jgi:hypothetical protein
MVSGNIEGSRETQETFHSDFYWNTVRAPLSGLINPANFCFATSPVLHDGKMPASNA